MANLKNLSKKSKSQSMGMHAEVLKGRTQQRFFDSEEAENFFYSKEYQEAHAILKGIVVRHHQIIEGI